MVRDEADIIGTVIRHLLSRAWSGSLIADNLSTDGTHEILEDLARSHPVTVLMDRLPDYYQGEKTTLLARAAARAGAGWVIPFDADEIWMSPTGSLAEWLGGVTAAVVQAPMFNHVPDAVDDLAEPDPVRRLRWRKTQPNRLHKVAFRAHRRARVAYGNHGVSRRATGWRVSRSGTSRTGPRSSSSASCARAAAALNATDLTDQIGKAWRGLGARDDDGLRSRVARAGRDPEPPLRMVGARARGSSRIPWCSETSRRGRSGARLFVGAPSDRTHRCGTQGRRRRPPPARGPR